MRENGVPQTLLQSLIRGRDASYESTARELEKFARHQDLDGTISARHLQRLARLERVNVGGQPAALPSTRRLLTEFFGRPFAELVSPPPPAERLSSSWLTQPTDHAEAVPAIGELTTTPAQKIVIPDRVALAGAPTPTTETLDWLEQQLHSQYAADNLLGPRVLMPLMIEYVNSIEEMQREARGSVLERLLRIGAGYAEFTGWLYHDAGDLRSASLWVSRAFEWAEGGGDDRMTSFVTMRRAAAALTAGQGGLAVRFAQRAQRFDSTETGRVRIIAAVTEAHGHAITGDGSGADRALDTAARLLEQYDGEITAGDPTANRYCELSLYAKIATAKCALALGRGGASVTAFTDVIDSLPTGFRRDRGQYLSSLARAYTLAEQPEAAVTAAREAYAIAIATGSARTLATLRDVLPSELARWSRNPEVEQFCAMLTAVEPEIGGS